MAKTITSNITMTRPDILTSSQSWSSVNSAHYSALSIGSAAHGGLHAAQCNGQLLAVAPLCAGMEAVRGEPPETLTHTTTILAR